MAQNVQVSTSIRDRQIYQTLQKLAKGLSAANRFVERASGTISFTDAAATPGVPTLIGTVAINTGYVPLEEEKLSVFTGNVYNYSNTTLTGSFGANVIGTVTNEVGEIIMLVDLWTADNYDYTDLTADWVLLETKP